MDDDISLKREALKRGRAEGARMINLLRMAAAVCFVFSYLVIMFGMGGGKLRLTFPLILVFLSISIVIWLIAHFATSFSMISRFAIPILDIPLILFIQKANLLHSNNPQNVALFTLAVFLFLVTLAAYSLNTRVVTLSAICAAAGFLYLQYLADGEMVSYLIGPVLIAITAFLSASIPIRALRIISETALQEAQRKKLSLYFSPGIAEHIVDSKKELGESEKCELTVLFCDIRGFTSMSENLDANEVVDFLNRFFSLMVEEVFKYGGTLDKYLGDGLMAYFNAPVRQEDHGNRAIECALAMEAIVHQSEVHQLGDIQIGVGIHTGEAVVGNIGADHRREFTVIGDTVNVASRIQSLTKDYQTNILMSESTWASIDQAKADSSGLNAKIVGESEIRGREGKVGLLSPEI